MSQFPFRHKYLWGKRHAPYHLSVTHRFWGGVGAPAYRTRDPIQSVWSQQTRKPEERKDMWPWYGVKKERNNVTHRNQDIYHASVFSEASLTPISHKYEVQWSFSIFCSFSIVSFFGGGGETFLGQKSELEKNSSLSSEWETQLAAPLAFCCSDWLIWHRNGRGGGRGGERWRMIRSISTNIFTHTAISRGGRENIFHGKIKSCQLFAANEERYDEKL